MSKIEKLNLCGKFQCHPANGANLEGLLSFYKLSKHTEKSISTMYESQTLRSSREYIHHVPGRRLNRTDILYAVAIQIRINPT